MSEIQGTVTPEETVEGTVYASELSGQQNAEVIDARTGWNGNVFKSLGEAIRTQVTNLWNAISGKQNTISDLDEIRSGASKGATALQSFTETDPTVPDWAKEPNKPSYNAEEVGARPSDWMPTAEQVGARPNTWLPTPAEIGSAPAGYGLGEGSGNVITTLAQLDSVKVNSFRNYYGEALPVDGARSSNTSQGGVLTIYGQGCITQYFFLRYPSRGSVLKRYTTTDGSVWEPWEWVNPPMTPGFEYRTTERHNGKPVYKMVIFYTFAESVTVTSFTDVSVPTGISNFNEVVYADAVINNISLLPYWGVSDGNIALIKVNGTSATLRYTKQNVISGEKATIRLAYTKTTD